MHLSSSSTLNGSRGGSQKATASQLKYRESNILRAVWMMKEAAATHHLQRKGRQAVFLLLLPPRRCHPAAAAAEISQPEARPRSPAQNAVMF